MGRVGGFQSAILLLGNLYFSVKKNSSTPLSMPFTNEQSKGNNKRINNNIPVISFLFSENFFLDNYFLETILLKFECPPSHRGS